MLVGKKKFDEKFKHVLGIIEYSQDRLEREKRRLNLITNKEGDPLSCMTLLGHDYHQMASVNLLVDKDIEKMKESINTMLDLKVARKMVYDKDLYFDFYLQIYALIYAKIALYHGIDLKVDSDIAPKELIDNTPAKEYPEPYEFMKKFDFKTITAEEWKAWIYEYHPEPEELKESEERGYIFV